MIWIVFLSMVALCVQNLLFYRNLIKKEEDRLNTELEESKAWRSELEKFQRGVWDVRENLDEIKRQLKHFGV